MVVKRFKIYCDELFYANLYIAYQHFYEGLLLKMIHLYEGNNSSDMSDRSDLTEIIS